MLNNDYLTTPLQKPKI